MSPHDHHGHDAPELTRNQALVLGELESSVAPLSAYTLLDRLRGDGLRAPLQIYRALDKLMEFGLVHRLESLNAFVACCRPEGEAHGTTAFAICGKCGRVSEFASEAIEGLLAKWAAGARFRPDKTTIELRGLCAACAA